MLRISENLITMEKLNQNFNSVENLPHLNAQAAFQVDSSAVFCEQGGNLSVSFCCFKE
jgi:hypothetical protein